MISLKQCERDVSRHLEQHKLSDDKALDSECKSLLVRAGNRPGGGGGGELPYLFELYGDVPLDRVWFLASLS